MSAASPQTRAVLAALAHPVCRKVFAHIELGSYDPSTESDTAVAAAVTRLEKVGLIVLSASGYVVNAAGLEQLLVQQRDTEPGNEVVARFLRSGTIERFPAKYAERLQLMRYVAAAVFSAGQKLSEPQVNRRLAEFHPDTALMRRFMVDEKIIARDGDGSHYWLIADEGEG